jgi:hypothetical protein
MPHKLLLVKNVNEKLTNVKWGKFESKIEQLKLED